MFRFAIILIYPIKNSWLGWFLNWGQKKVITIKIFDCLFRFAIILIYPIKNSWLGWFLAMISQEL